MNEQILIITDTKPDGVRLAEQLRLEHLSASIVDAQIGRLDDIDRGQFRLVLVDARCQESQADVLCKAIRRSPKGAVLPIICFGTGRENIKNSADAIACGADFFFLLDEELSALIQKCKHYLGNQEPHTQDPSNDKNNDAEMTLTDWPDKMVDTRAASPSDGHGKSELSDWMRLDGLLTNGIESFPGDETQGLGTEFGDAEELSMRLAASAVAPETPASSPSAATGVSRALSKGRHGAEIGLQTGRAVEINQRGLGEILNRCRRYELTGRIEVASQGVLRRIFLDAGRPVFFDSSSGSEDLVSTLVAEGVLTQDQVDQAREQGRMLNLSPEEVLIDSGQVDPKDVQQILRTHVERKLLDLFSIESGEVVVIQGGPRPVDPVNIETPLNRVILDGIRRKFGRLRLYRVFGTGSKVPRKSEETDPGCRLTASEQSVLSRIDGSSSINALARATGIDETECLAIVYALSVINLVTVPHTDRSVDQRLAIPASGYTLAKHPMTQDASPGFAELVARKYREVLYADYFTLLGVGRDANRAEVAASYERLRQQFDPNRVSKESGMHQTVTDISMVLNDAFAVLNHDGYRRSYEVGIDTSES